jgi:imidazolonepropionase-like amidohydrolase
MSSGGVVSLTDPIKIPQYSAEEIQTVSEEAKRRNSYVAAHAYSPEAIVHAVSNGVRSIEHGNLLDFETAKFMASRNAVLVPTLVTYYSMSVEGKQLGMNEVMLGKNSEVLESGKRAIELAQQAGVLTGFGTDLMGDLEKYQLEGIRHQADVLSSLELLKSMTSNNAKILNDTRLGTLKVDSVGDLVIFNKNPLISPNVLWEDKERMVIQSGTVVG